MERPVKIRPTVAVLGLAMVALAFGLGRWTVRSADPTSVESFREALDERVECPWHEADDGYMYLDVTTPDGPCQIRVPCLACHGTGEVRP